MSTQHAKMAERSIEMAERSIETIQNMVNGRSDSPLQLNRAQCKYLAQELANLNNYLQGRYDMFKAGQDVRQIAWLHLHSVIIRAELLVEKCCCKNVESWLLEAKTLVEIQEDFAAIILDLHQWRMAMDVAIAVVMGASYDDMENLLKLVDGEYQEAYKRLRSRDHALQQAAIEDRKEIVSKLAEVQESEDNLEYLCALHLRYWLAELDDQTHLSNSNVIQKLIKHVSHENSFLGMGGCGSVHRVNWLGVQCALKKLNVKDEREARVLKGLHHPNIVRLFMYWDDLSEIQTPYEADGTDGTGGHEIEPLPKSNLLMELMHTDLSGHIKRRMERMASSSREGEDMMPFSLPVAIDIMLQVGQALRFMHDKHFTHRDLKTANILVRRVNKALTDFYNEGYLEIKLADFGLAKAYEHTSTSQWQGHNAGTKKYGAPEVFEKDRSADREFPPMADVWSFGMTCSEILSGKVPYYKEYVPTLHARIVKGNLRPTLPKLCPEYLAFIIRGCWELQPERRPNFASICTMLSHAKLLSLGITKPDDSERFLRYTPRRGSEKILQNPRPQVAETSIYRKFMSYFQAPSEIVRRRSTGEVNWKENRMQSEVAGAKQQPRNHWTHTLRTAYIKTSIPFFRSGGVHTSLRAAVYEEFDVKPTVFSYGELRAATRDFHEDMKLGQGGFGAVYKGLLPSGQVVAIKQLRTTEEALNEFLNEFVNEVVLIAGMKHRNLVNLKGCCVRGSHRLLVYEFVDNYDVDQVLLGSKKEEMRSRLAGWPARHKICLGIAHGLHYLHAMVHPRVIHRDIKARNVLLTSHLEAKIADFGLAQLFPDEESYITADHIVGTRGYVAPEYATFGQLSDKVDIYSFGVLCLEIVSGRRNMDFSAPEDQENLAEWARRLHEQDKLIDLVDPTLQIRGEEVKDVQRFLIMCLRCISLATEKRPRMARIVSILQGDT